MINSDFIIRYTNALYSTPAEYAPRYDEFRDMFSSGQIKSKEWFLKNIKNFDAAIKSSKILIVGAWFGTLGILIKQYYPSSSITLLDIDARCEKYINNLIYDISGIEAVTEDMYTHCYTEDIIVNTSCEHIRDISEWVSLIPHNKIVILQSNNYRADPGHINCVDSADDFIKKAGLKEVWFSDALVLPVYTRYMIIGRT